MNVNQESLGWWGQQWLFWIRSLQAGPETDGQYRGALRAEGKPVLSRGRISARVQAGEHRQVTAVIRLKPWTDRQWRTAIEAVAARPELAQAVLSGYFGADLARTLAEADLGLFPGEAAVGCSCGSRSCRCRHLNFLVVWVAEQLDANPFLWMEVLGRERPALTAEVRAALADREGRSSRGAREPAEAVDPILFWEGAACTTLPTAPPAPMAPTAHGGQSPTDPAAFLRALGLLDWEEPLYLMPAREQVSVDEALCRMAAQVGQVADAWLKGERFRPAAPSPTVLPGKVAALSARLLPEVEAAVQGREQLCTMEELYDLCPTAQALPDAGEAMRSLREACRRLPPHLVVVADRYVGPASALLAGARFRHVVTFAEWLTGRVEEDADWVRALAAAGREMPDLTAAFRRLQPAVGDELWISPSAAGAEVHLVPRKDRDVGELLRADLTLGRMLPNLMGQVQRDRLTEGEAVAALLAEGVYRDGLHPDPIWLLPMFELGLYQDITGRVITRQPLYWRHGFPRFIYGKWRLDDALRWYQAGLMKQGIPVREIEMATACVKWWMRVWPGAQDSPAAAESLGSFLEFLWNVVPREAEADRIDPQKVPAFMEGWFATLEERYPAVAGIYAPHRKACGLTQHYADRLATAPGATATRGSLLAWLAEGFRWIGPAHYVAHGSYN